MKTKQLKLTQSIAQLPESYNKEISIFLRSYQFLDISHLITAYSLDDNDAFDIELSVLNKNIRIEVFPNEVRAEGYGSYLNGVKIDDQEPITTYKGLVKGTNNEVRLTIDHKGIRGFIQLDDQKLFIENIEKFGLKGESIAASVAYLEKDVIGQDGFFCGVTSELERKFVASIEKMIQGAEDFANCKILKVATDADYHFYTIYGSYANSEILYIINLIQGVYSSTFSVTPMVTAQNIWTTPNDPYTGDPSTDPGSELLVNELRNYWEANFTYIVRDVVHLFTGMGSNQPGVVGRVFEIGTICKSPNKSYGFTKDRFGSFTTTAHEIGHNFGGIHSDGINCGTNNASLMCQGEKAVPMYFSPASISRISGFINSYNFCLNADQYYKILGSDTLCNSTTYSIQNLPTTASVIWHVTPANLAELTTQNQNATLTVINNGIVSLQAEISDFCASPVIINKTITVAGRTPEITNITIQRSGPSCVGSDYQPISFGVVAEGASGCSLLTKGIVAVEWQFYNYGSAIAQLTNNAGAYYCPGQVDNAGITLGFASFSSPFMITLRCSIKNLCGEWSEFSPGFSFQIRRC